MFNDINEYARIYTDSFVNESMIDEAMVSVDDNYINAIQELLQDVKAAKPQQYDKIIARIESKRGQKLPDPASYADTWRKNLGLDKGPAQSRDELMQSVGNRNTEVAKVKPETRIVEVTVTDAKHLDDTTVQVTYDLIWNDGTIDKNNIYKAKVDEYEFEKTKREMHIPYDVDAAIAMVLSSFSTVSTYPIKYTLLNSKTQTKTDISKLATKRKSGSGSYASPRIDPKAQLAAELAAKMNRTHGSSNVRYSTIYDSEDGNQLNEATQLLNMFRDVF